MKESFKKTIEKMRNDSKPGIEEIPNNQNIEHLNIEDNGVKNQMIKKTTERGIVRPKKIKKTREELDMVRSGLVNIVSIPIINHREGMNVKNYRTNLMKMFEVNHQATMRKNLTNNILKLNTLGKEIRHKRSVMSSIIEIPLTYCCKKLDDEVIEVGRNTRKHV